MVIGKRQYAIGWIINVLFLFRRGVAYPYVYGITRGRPVDAKSCVLAVIVAVLFDGGIPVCASCSVTR